jgi:hypothetical protein
LAQSATVVQLGLQAVPAGSHPRWFGQATGVVSQLPLESQVPPLESMLSKQRGPPQAAPTG